MLDQPLGTQVVPTVVSGPYVPALEGPIDRSAYLLGPGDYLELVAWGNIEVRETLKVSPDGTIGIPTVGILEVAGKSLAETEKLVKSFAGKRYPRSVISLRLIGIRKILISISGELEAPGLYEVTPVDRLSKLISLAGGLSETGLGSDRVDLSTADDTEKPPKESVLVSENYENELISPVLPTLRHILLTSRNGQTREVDYQRYLKTGDLDYNPLLQDGDQVHIPAKNIEVGVINIFGVVKAPGEYEFVAGDKLYDIIELAGGFHTDAMTARIVIDRFIAEGISRENIVVDLSNVGESDRGPYLQADDRIFVRRKVDFHRKYHIEVIGEVKFPGVYPIDADNVSLVDMLEICGGFTDVADIESARLIREGWKSEDDSEFERLKDLEFHEMSEMEQWYFTARSREGIPEVVVDFKELFTNGLKEMDVILNDGDVIEVPRLNPVVRVAGQVAFPGLINYSPGMSFDYYIGKAGGYSWNARLRKIRLIKAETGIWIKPLKNTKIEVGDTIFVPVKQEFSTWKFTKELLLILTQVTTIFVVVQTFK